MVYHSQAVFRFAIKEKLSPDLARSPALAYLVRLLGVFVAGLLGDWLGLKLAYYFAFVLALLATLTCLYLPKETLETVAEPGGISVAHSKS